MKRVILLLLLQLSAIAVFSDEYIDAKTNVIYTYDPAGNLAEVKQGEDWTIIGSRSSDDFYDTSQDPIYYPGSPNAKAEIVILDRFSVGGKEYTVNKIGNFAFANMKDMVSVVIPSTVQIIGREAFYYCQSLENVVLSEGLTSICEFAFAGCESLASISLPETLETMGLRVFSLCTSLEAVSIPANVTDVGNLTFMGCLALSRITVEEGNMTYDSRDNCNAIIETASNMLVIGCKGTQIPASVTSVGQKALTYCKGLESISVPGSVVEIEAFAFASCPDLKNIHFSEGLKTIQECAFQHTSPTSITIPSTVRSIGDGAFYTNTIETITSLIEDPFMVQFLCQNPQAVTLRVPIGTKSKYESTLGWHEFKIIEEFEPSDIDTPTLYTKALVNCYDLLGRCLNAEPKYGVYIKNGKKVLK